MIPWEWQSRKRPQRLLQPSGFTFLLLLHISLNFLLKIMLILYHDICTTGYNNIVFCRLDGEVISAQMVLLTKLHRHSGVSSFPWSESFNLVLVYEQLYSAAGVQQCLMNFLCYSVRCGQTLSFSLRISNPKDKHAAA